MNEPRFRLAEQRLWASEGVAPSERRLDLRRTATTIRVQEVGEGLPVILVHGASNTGSSWAQLVSRLDGLRCVMVDRPGCGLSEPLKTSFRDVDQLAAFADGFIVDVLDALRLDQAAVIATSFGGYSALRGAAAYPDRITRVVELGWTVGAPIGHTPFVMRLASIPMLGRMMAAIPANERMVRAMFKGIGLRQALAAGRVTQEVIDCFLAMLRDTDTMRNELKAGPRILTPIRGMNDSLLLPESLLATITAPTYFLWGDEDPIGGADIARTFTSLLPHAELELMPGAGHAVWIDDPDYAAKTVQQFLSR